MALRRLFEAALLLTLLAAAAQPVLAANMYRYKDDNGRTVFNSFIPPEFVARGYEILDERGRVIQVVPRALTPEEIAARDAAAEAQRLQEAAARAQREADQALQSKYRAPEEIAEERDQTLAMLDADLALARENLDDAALDLAAPEEVLAEAAAAGVEAPAELLAEVEAKRQVLARFAEQVARLESERVLVISTADSNMRRLRELLGLPEQPAAE